MSAIDRLFKDLASRQKKAFVPFITAGDPNLETTGRLIRLLAERGSSICEIGIPYSDPIADGPVIQASYTRALDQQIKLDQILTMIDRVAAGVDMPLISMVSYAIIVRRGLRQYVEDARAAGLSGLIVPDLLIEEADRLAGICRDLDMSLIQLVTPTTPRPRAIQIANASSGFLYYVAVTGITGERRDLPAQVVDQVGWLREQTELPICIGFGISRPEHVRTLRDVADGVIVGSALVRHLERIGDEGEQTALKDVTELVDAMIAALND